MFYVLPYSDVCMNFTHNSLYSLYIFFAAHEYRYAYICMSACAAVESLFVDVCIENYVHQGEK